MSEVDPMHDFTARWISAQPAVATFIKSAVRDSHYAEDLLQDVANKALVNYRQYDRSRPFVPWVLGIARNQILIHYRKRKSDRLVFSESQLKSIEDGHSHISTSMHDRSAAIDECVGRLEDRAANVLRMRYGNGLAVQEISSQLGTTTNAISRLLYKVRLILKDCVEMKLGLKAGGN